MKVLVLGGGAREHAICWSLASSTLITKLYCAPGNPGIEKEALCVDLDIENNKEVLDFAKKSKIDLVVPGPEIPLVNGIVDELKQNKIRAFGPSKAAALLEGSKKFTKDICNSAKIPTAKFNFFTEMAPAIKYLNTIAFPIVIKADGLAAGKGVTIAKDISEAKEAVKNSFNGIFGTAGMKILIEEFLEGPELSYFALCDGKTAIPISNAQDHKRVGENDVGPNTGGMGAFSPSQILTENLEHQIINKIINPTLKELIKRGTPYQGVLYAGLIITKEGPKLIEYNVRFGDPECQVLLTRMKSNLLEALIASCDQTLESFNIRFFEESTLTVVMASKGYPGKYIKGSEISGIEEAEKIRDVKVFHAGTTKINNILVSSGGRVLSVTSKAKTIEDARSLAYKAIKKIRWKDGFFRSDIGLK